MRRDSRVTIHMGINFVFSPVILFETQSRLGFQQALVNGGVDFTRADFREHEILILRDKPTPLEIKVAALPPSPVGQLLLVAPNPNRDLEVFIQEVEAVLGAFNETWRSSQRQIIASDATLRDLYETTTEHAFLELWERRLHQPPESLAALGRPVLGGGLRFVMPPRPDDPEPVQIEVKIESFLQDTRKIFVETQFSWTAPMPPGAAVDPRAHLEQIDRYIERHIEPFIQGE